MTTAIVYDAGGNRVGELELAAGVFGITPHSAVLHEAVAWQLAGRRRGTHASDADAGRGQPHHQEDVPAKGQLRPRARHGARGAPIFVGGGVVFGPRPRDHSYSLPKKVRHLAIRSALSEKALEGRISVLDRLELTQPKTSVLAKMLRAVEVEGKVLLVTAGLDPIVVRSAANIPGVHVIQAANLNVHLILISDRILIVRDALDQIAEVLVP